TVDMSITCSNKQEAGGCQLFYKPQQGFVGDPMPYFYANDNNFYFFYLYENANHPPIYLPTSAGSASFARFTELIRLGARGNQRDGRGALSINKNDHTYCSFYTSHDENLNRAKIVMMPSSQDLQGGMKHPTSAFQAANGDDQEKVSDPRVYGDETQNSDVML